MDVFFRSSNRIYSRLVYVTTIATYNERNIRSTVNLIPNQFSCLKLLLDCLKSPLASNAGIFSIRRVDLIKFGYNITNCDWK